MALPTAIVPKDKDRDKPRDGSGATLEATTQALTIRTGADQEIAHNPLNHIFLPKTITLWICLPLSVKLQMTKNVKSTIKRADALNVESKVLRTESATPHIQRIPSPSPPKAAPKLKYSHVVGSTL